MRIQKGASVDFSFEKKSGKGRKEERRYFEGGPGKAGSKMCFLRVGEVEWGAELV